MTGRRLGWVAAVAVVLVVSACGSDRGGTATATTVGDGAVATTAATGGEVSTLPDAGGGSTLPDAGGSTVPAAGGESRSVTVAIPQDVLKLDALDTTGVAEIAVTWELFDPLFMRQPDGSSKPHLATGMEQSADGMTWTIHLRDDVYFHNGDHMTSADLVWSINRIKSDGFPGGLPAYWVNVASVEATDDYTVVAHMSKPDGLLQWNASRTSVLPSKYFESVGAEEFGKHPVGSGPYQFVEWKPDDRIVLKKFDNYWGPKPTIDEEIIRPIPEEASQVAALLTGEIDVTSPLSQDAIKEIEGHDGVEVRYTDSLSRARLMIDTNVAPFNIPEVRKAVNHAIDKKLICDELLGGLCTPIPAGLTPLDAGYLDLPIYDYDPDLSRQLLTQAGFPNGIDQTFELSYRTNEVAAEQVATAMAAMLEDVGFHIKLKAYTVEEFADAGKNKTSGPLMFSSHGGGDVFHASNNLRAIYSCHGNPIHSGYYCNPQIDTLLDQAEQVWATDQPQAIKLYQQAQQILYDDAGSGFLYQYRSAYGVRTNLQWQPQPTGYFRMVNANWTS